MQRTLRYYACSDGDLSEISEPDADFRVAIESLTDMHKLPFCPDCFGELGWAEPVYGPGLDNACSAVLYFWWPNRSQMTFDNRTIRDRPRFYGMLKL